ncbi:MAG: hypothetical protein ACE5JD_00235 [Candidatus Methylomirabilia bacterium]
MSDRPYESEVFERGKRRLDKRGQFDQAQGSLPRLCLVKHPGIAQDLKSQRWLQAR